MESRLWSGADGETPSTLIAPTVAVELMMSLLAYVYDVAVTAPAAQAASGGSTSVFHHPPSEMSCPSGGPSPYGPSPHCVFVREKPWIVGLAIPSSKVLSPRRQIVFGKTQ